MVSRSLLLVLLVLGCLQSFTAAHNGNGPDQCCFRYQTHRIPASHIKAYEETHHQCTNPGVILDLKVGRHVCANPDEKWVQDTMKTIDQRA
ncbi:C-C motif chemokine 4 homolog [Ictalurus furcatus]|uniref:C-C motif chemokine 4 homolog n=1 Tax=Ictalurus furcatus TaxID=66913 RepID=UPI00234FE699|nr:C-C motif chemokine 4 homolog [Ictalurus furcatus]